MTERLDDIRDLDGSWDYSDLPGDVVVGADCFIERRESFRKFRSKRHPGLSIGDRVTIYTWTEFSVEPEGRVVVGDDAILVGAIIMCAQRVEIGERVVISYGVTIADSDFHPRDPAARRKDAVANAPYGDRRNRPDLESAAVVIGPDARIGIGAFILKGVTIGAGATVEPGSVVTSDVPPGARFGGNPARAIGLADE